MPTPTFGKVSSGPVYGPGSEIDVRAGRHLGGACGASVLMHGAAIGLLLAFAWAVKETVQPDVPFEVLTPPGAATEDAVSGPGEQAAGTSTNPDEGRLLTKLPSVRVWTPPRDLPAVADEAVDLADNPPVKSVVARPVSSRPTPPRATQVSNGPRINYGDYVSQKGLPGATPAKVAPGEDAGTTKTLHIIAPKLGGGPGNGAGDIKAAQSAGMPAYFTELVQRLSRSHEKPAGLSDALRAEVEFTLAASGMLSSVRIVRSSGDADFDRSVLAAFSRVKMGARPDGKTDLQRLTFRLESE